MGKKKLSYKRPTLTEAIEWIAHNDNAGNGDSKNDIAGYLSTALAADLFACGQHRLADRIAIAREQAGIEVAPMAPDTLREFYAECGRELRDLEQGFGA